MRKYYTYIVIFAIAIVAFVESKSKIFDNDIFLPIRVHFTTVSVEQKIIESLQLDSISRLHPYIREAVLQTFMEANQRGIDARFTSTIRDAKHQNFLYQSGRTAPGTICTYADGYSSMSYHQFGLAFDVHIPSFRYAEFAEIAQRNGFFWGGNWTGIYCEPWHFQRSYGYTNHQLKAMLANGSFEGKYLQFNR